MSVSMCRFHELLLGKLGECGRTWNCWRAGASIGMSPAAGPGPGPGPGPAAGRSAPGLVAAPAWGEVLAAAGLGTAGGGRIMESTPARPCSWAAPPGLPPGPPLACCRLIESKSLREPSDSTAWETTPMFRQPEPATSLRKHDRTARELTPSMSASTLFISNAPPPPPPPPPACCAACAAAPGGGGGGELRSTRSTTRPIPTSVVALPGASSRSRSRVHHLATAQAAANCGCSPPEASGLPRAEVRNSSRRAWGGVR